MLAASLICAGFTHDINLRLIGRQWYLSIALVLPIGASGITAGCCMDSRLHRRMHRHGRQKQMASTDLEA